MLKKRLGGRHLGFTDAERRRLARRAYAFGRKALTSWRTFLKSHWQSIAATDFFKVEVFMLRGLVTRYLLFILDLASRTVKIAGITPHPHEAWMVQMARNLTDAEEPFLRRTRFLIMNRDTKYSAAFRAALTRERIEPIRLPPRSSI